MGGLAAVAVVAALMLAVAVIAGVSLAPLVERRDGPALPVGVLAGLGLAGLATAVVLAWRLGTDLAVSVVVIVAIAVTGATAVIALTVRRGGVAALRLADRHGGAAVAALVIALVALAPLAVHGFGAWTAFINDFHRYALSALSWLADSGSGPAFVDRFTGAYGSGATERASFEKPGATGLLVLAAGVTTISPAQLLTPLTAVLVAITLVALSSLLRLGPGLDAVSATAVATLAVLAPIAWDRVMDAQLGQSLSLALLATTLALVAFIARLPTTPVLRTGAAVGLSLAAAVGANVTLAISALPLVGAIALTLLLRTGRDPRSAFALAGASLGAATLLIAPIAPLLLLSLSSQTTGLGSLPDIALAHPIELLGVRGPDDTIGAVTTWAALLVAIAIAGTHGARPLVLLLPVVAAAASGVTLGLLYGLDSYELGKWLGIAVPVVGACGVGWLMARLRPVTGREATPMPRAAVAAATLVLAASALIAGATASTAVSRIVGPALFAGAAHPAVTALDAVTVDTGDYYVDSILPARVEAARVAVAGQTYAPGGPPIGSHRLTTGQRASERGWTVVERLPGDLVLARLPSVTTPLDRAGADLAPLLSGDWLPPEPGGVWSRGPGPAWITLDLSDPLPARGAVLRLSLLVPANSDGPRTLTVTVGTRVLALPASPDDVRQLSIPVSADDLIDNQLVIGLDLDEAASMTLLNPADQRVLEAAVTRVELLPVESVPPNS